MQGRSRLRKLLERLLLSASLTSAAATGLLGQSPASAGNAACRPANTSAPDQALELAVQLKTYAGGGVAQDATGILIGEQGNTVYVATAAHVITDVDTRPDSVLAFFYKDCSRSVRATVCSLAEPKHDLDLATLCVPAAALRRPRSSSYSRLGSVGRLGARTPVYPVGCPAGVCWVVGQPDKVLVAGPNEPRIIFTSFFASPGHSGGPLFNEWWEVVGMLSKYGKPFSEAIPIDSVLSAACDTGCRLGEETLQKPFVPRGRYGWSLGVQGLFQSGETEPGGRFPAGRGTIIYRLNPLLELHGGSIRLIPANLSVTAGVVGIGLNLPTRGRLWLNPFLEGGFAHVEGRFDAGGHFIDNGGVNQYVPLWRQVKDDGLGFGAGVSLQVLLLPRTIVEVIGGHWSFNRPEGAPRIPDFFWGAGLRLGL